MHIYFIPRGIFQQLELFKIFLQAQMWPWVRKDTKTEERIITMFQGAVRDLGFCWCYTFPEECLEDVCNMLGIEPGAGEGDNKISKIKMFGIRTILGNGVKKLPKKITTPKDQPRIMLQDPITNQAMPYRYVEKRGIQIHVIGYKKDIRSKLTQANGLEVEQEML